MVMRFLRVIAGLIILALIVSCQKLSDLEGVEAEGYQAEFAIPLFKGKASLQDLFKNLEEGASITIGQNGLITFNYDSPTVSQTSQDIFDFISTFPPFTLDTMMAVPFQPPNNVDVDRIELKTGRILYTYESPFAEDVTIEFMIPQATKDGVVFKKEVGVEYNGEDLPVLVPVTEIDITGYTIIPQNDSIFLQYRATTASGQNVVMDKFAMIFRDMEFAYAEGYMGSELLDFEKETLAIDFFDDWTQGNVTFENPSIDVVVSNSFGFPIEIQPQAINIKTRDGGVIPLEGQFTQVGTLIDYPQLSEIGQTKVTTISFTGTNSNIKEILAAGPIEVEYDIDALSNPDSNTLFTGFLTDQSRFDIQLLLQLPIWGTASGFVTQDTFQVDFEEYENVDFAEFRLNTENSIPLEVAMQLYFADDNGLILDSLFTTDEIILAAAPVDATGEVNGTTEKFTEIPKSAVEFNQLKTATQLFLKASFQTSNQGTVPVRVLSDQSVELKMGMKIGFTR